MTTRSSGERCTLPARGLLAKALGLVIYLGIYGILAYVTFFFARPALTRGLAARLRFGNHQRRATGVEPGDPVFHVGRRS